jgi:hypothetical protein
MTKRVNVYASSKLTVKSIVLGLYTPDANLRDMSLLDALAAVVRSAFMMGWRVELEV